MSNRNYEKSDCLGYFLMSWKVKLTYTNKIRVENEEYLSHTCSSTESITFRTSLQQSSQESKTE